MTQYRTQDQPYTIRTDTAIMPAAIAVGVREEIENYLGVELDICAVESHLVTRAEGLYALSDYWRKKIQSKAQHGNAGRDLLWAFMRHWICGWVKDHCGYEAYNRIPQNYLVGGDLP